MVGELDLLNEWIPEQMYNPGTVFVLEKCRGGSARRKIPIGRYCRALRAACWA